MGEAFLTLQMLVPVVRFRVERNYMVRVRTERFQRIQKVVGLHSMGLKLQEIADLLGVSAYTISEDLKLWRRSEVYIERKPPVKRGISLCQCGQPKGKTAKMCRECYVKQGLQNNDKVCPHCGQPKSPAAAMCYLCRHGCPPRKPRKDSPNL